MLLLLGCFASIAGASSFQALIDNSWFNAGNWSTGVVPVISDGFANDIASSVTCKVSGDDANCVSLLVNNAASLVVEANGSLQASAFVNLGYAAADNSGMAVANAKFGCKDFNVGYNGTGTATFTNSVYVPYVTVPGAATTFYIGREKNSNGTVTFDHSTLNFNSDGSNNYLTFVLGVFGTDSTGTSTLNIIDSAITVGRYLNVGQTGTGNINMTSGTLNVVERMQVGLTSGVPYIGNGNLQMTGGTINVTGQFRVKTGTASRFSTMNISGGTLNVIDLTNFGSNSRISINGTAVASLGDLLLDSQYIGDANFTDAQVSLAGNANVSCDSLAITAGVLDLKDAAVLRIKGDVLSQVSTYIYTGKITGGGVARQVTAVYDQANDQTVLTLGAAAILKKAYLPVPESGQAISRDEKTFSWTAGDGASSHKLYISKNYDEVANASIAPIYTGTAAEYTFAQYFDAGTYYWRVDEYDGSATTAGDVWSFTASGLFVDNFEYTDNTALLNVWTQGAGTSISLDADGGDIVLNYDNTAAPYYSQITRVPPFANFNGNQLKSMDIRYCGNSANSACPVFVTISDGVNSATLVSSQSATVQTVWQTWSIAYSEFTQANPSLNLANITSISIGVGNKNAPVAGGAGTVSFGRVQLFEPRCTARPVSDLNNDCKVDLGDVAVMSANWLTDQSWPGY